MSLSWQVGAVERPKNKDIFPDHLDVWNLIRKLMNNVIVPPYTVFSLVIQENQLDSFEKKDN